MQILPSLESFCIYAAAGVLMTFIFAITFFVACFVIDQRRIEQKRNGIIPCIVQENYVPNECSQRKISNRIFYLVYSKVILSIPGKVSFPFIGYYTHFYNYLSCFTRFKLIYYCIKRWQNIQTKFTSGFSVATYKLVSNQEYGRKPEVC